VKSVSGGAGGPPIWPAGISTFCWRMALVMSGTVRPSLASWSGLIQTRIAYSKAEPPATVACPTPRMRASSSSTLIVA